MAHDAGKSRTGVLACKSGRCRSGKRRRRMRLIGAAGVLIATALAFSPHPQSGTTSNTVVLGLLTSGNSNIELPKGVETGIMRNSIYAPCSPDFDPSWSVLPVVGCPLPYSYWEVDLRVAPLTVVNTDKKSGTVTVNIYSDNAYVYQQQATVAPGQAVPIYFGAQALGAIASAAGAAPMNIAVTMTAMGADMEAIMDTQAPANFVPGHTYAKVAGFSVQLTPMQ
jgi:hypothetical protein